VEGADENVLKDVNGKGKGRHITGYEGPKVEYMYICTLTLTSAIGGGE